MILKVCKSDMLGQCISVRKFENNLDYLDDS